MADSLKPIHSKIQQKKTDKEELSDTTINSDNKESVDLSDMPSLEDNEKVKEGKGLKILTPNKLLTTLSILLAQIKAGNNSFKLKNEIRQILYLLYQHNKITKKVYNLIKSLVIIIMEENMTVIKEPRTLF